MNTLQVDVFEVRKDSLFFLKTRKNDISYFVKVYHGFEISSV